MVVEGRGRAVERGVGERFGDGGCLGADRVERGLGGGEVEELRVVGRGRVADRGGRGEVEAGAGGLDRDADGAGAEAVRGDAEAGSGAAARGSIGVGGGLEPERGDDELGGGVAGFERGPGERGDSGVTGLDEQRDGGAAGAGEAAALAEDGRERGARFEDDRQRPRRRRWIAAPGGLELGPQPPHRAGVEPPAGLGALVGARHREPPAPACGHVDPQVEPDGARGGARALHRVVSHPSRWPPLDPPPPLVPSRQAASILPRVGAGSDNATR
ncbi:MAG: hypothetical protein R3F65_07905 [bacterium]